MRNNPLGRHWLHQFHRCGAELLGAVRSIGSLRGPDTLGVSVLLNPAMGSYRQAAR